MPLAVVSGNHHKPANFKYSYNHFWLNELFDDCTTNKYRYITNVILLKNKFNCKRFSVIWLPGCQAAAATTAAIAHCLLVGWLADWLLLVIANIYLPTKIPSLSTMDWWPPLGGRFRGIVGTKLYPMAQLTGSCITPYTYMSV